MASGTMTYSRRQDQHSPYFRVDDEEKENYVRIEARQYRSRKRPTSTVVENINHQLFAGLPFYLLAL